MIEKSMNLFNGIEIYLKTGKDAQIDDSVSQWNAISLLWDRPPIKLHQRIDFFSDCLLKILCNDFSEGFFFHGFAQKAILEAH